MQSAGKEQNAEDQDSKNEAIQPNNNMLDDTADLADAVKSEPGGDSDDDKDPALKDVEPGSDADSDDASLGVESDLQDEDELEPNEPGRPAI